MSNYTQTTFFGPKDSLPAGNPAKTIFGAPYDVEFGNIATAIASKLDASTVTGPIAFTNQANTFTGGLQTITAQPNAGALLVSANTAVLSVGLVQFNAAGTVDNLLYINGVPNGNATIIFAQGTSNIAEIGLSGPAGQIITGSVTGDFNILATAGSINLSTVNTRIQVQITPSGTVTIAAPTAGTALTVAGFATQYTAIFTGATGAGTSFGLRVNAGTNATDQAFQVNRRDIAVTFLQINGDGTVIVSPSGANGSLLTTNAALTTGAGASAGTITNAPSAGNPTKWIKINDNGTIRAVPAW